LFAITAEDAARLMNLIDRRIPRPGLHRTIVLGGLEVDRIGWTSDRAEPARHALFQTVLVPHEHLLTAVLREHRYLLFVVVDRDRFLEQVLERGAEAYE